MVSGGSPGAVRSGIDPPSMAGVWADSVRLVKSPIRARTATTPYATEVFAFLGLAGGGIRVKAGKKNAPRGETPAFSADCVP